MLFQNLTNVKDGSISLVKTKTTDYVVRQSMCDTALLDLELIYRKTFIKVV